MGMNFPWSTWRRRPYGERFPDSVLHAPLPPHRVVLLKHTSQAGGNAKVSFQF
jgi:hypothetical protein